MSRGHILREIEDKKLDPRVAHKKVGKDGRLLDSAKPAEIKEEASVEAKQEVRNAIVELAPTLIDEKQEEVLDVVEESVTAESEDLDEDKPKKSSKKKKTSESL